MSTDTWKLFALWIKIFKKYVLLRASFCGACVVLIQGKFSKGNVLSTYTSKHSLLVQETRFFTYKRRKRESPPFNVKLATECSTVQYKLFPGN